MTRSWEVKATTEGLVTSHLRLPLTQESHLFLPCLQSTGSLQLVGLSTRPWPSLSLEGPGVQGWYSRVQAADGGSRAAR